MSRRKISAKKQKPTFISVSIIILVICCMGICLFKTDSVASSHINREKCYKSIKIQAGDSIWNIAMENYTNDWESLESYIEEIKEFNGLKGEEINYDNYISIPYYTEVAD